MEGMDVWVAWLCLTAIFNGLVCAGFCSELAKHKGHNTGNAVVLGFLFGLFALLTYVGLPDLKQRQVINRLNDQLERISHL